MEARTSFLVSKREFWAKKTEVHFEVTMGAHDGAEIAELLGLSILEDLNKIENFSGGLYRDDCLAVTSLPARVVEHSLKKKIRDVFRSYNLEVTFENYSDTVNFLNVTLDLKNNIFKPYRKDNNDLLYVNSESNHPPLITKNIPQGIEVMLNQLSSNENIFNEAKAEYQEALNDRGYRHNLEFKNKDDIPNKGKKTDVGKHCGLIRPGPVI